MFKYLLSCILLTVLVLLIWYCSEDIHPVVHIRYINDNVRKLHLNALPDTYKSLLFNLTLRYIHEPQWPCKGCANLSAMLLVTSHANHFELRSAMRRAFPAAELIAMGFCRFFLLAQDAPTATTQQEIDFEQQRFGDLLQGNFLESYRNLTYKHVMGLKWAGEHALDMVQFLVKMDDDIVVDIRGLRNIFRKLQLSSNTIAGYVMNNMSPIRAPKQNKWYISKMEYAKSSYPTFVSGWLYVIRPKLASKLALLTHYVPFLWIDDVYVTGILGEHLGVTYMALNHLFVYDAAYFECCMRRLSRTRTLCGFLIGPNGGDNNLFFTFNELVKMCYPKYEQRATQESVDIACHDHKQQKSLNETCVTEWKVKLSHGRSLIENYQLG